MPRLINKLFNITQCLRRSNYFAIEVINQRGIINKNFSSAPVEQQYNNKNNEFNESVHKNSSIIEASVLEVKNVIDENFEWVDEPADKIKLPKALDICEGDISEYVTPYTQPTFNFALYANDSPTIQELVKLGVEVYRFERSQRIMKIILGRNFDDMKPYIQFLHDCGVPADQIGRSLTNNPFLFEQDLDDLRTRIRYLRSHNFNLIDVATIVTNNHVWLNYSTIQIDERLAYFQREFKLTGDQVRKLAVKEPRTITYHPMRVRDVTFSVREEMGFDREQMKSILLNNPKLWMRDRSLIVETFDYLHNVMNLPHELIAGLPEILSTHFQLVKTRHEFLKSLDRAQYDPEKPLYTSPISICTGTDYEFCINIAKTSIELFDMFVKSR